MTRARRTHTDFRCCRTKTFTIGVLLRLSTQTPLIIANVGVNTFSDNRPAAVCPRERLQLLTYRCRSLIQQHTRIYKALRREVSRHRTESMCLRDRESFVTATVSPSQHHPDVTPFGSFGSSSTHVRRHTRTGGRNVTITLPHLTTTFFFVLYFLHKRSVEAASKLGDDLGCYFFRAELL